MIMVRINHPCLRVGCHNNLVCAPCHHGKVIPMSHSPVNTMMTEQLEQMLHMDTVGPSRVRSVGGK
jgi:hypothetical protein